ncbi:MAG: tRNA (N6-isopentenyl adenosine(37)-C2)-methylthiotransferase MiaB [Bifidobacteriaceae bacterium]|jgi:tRNA-2-methylthio-N6-dimethylallyladenosine synthase|nr:tRNA (N6-isopentenyl adenosine(37)-C2)-methylthiotransferase MiaB [Bifidobacteriaceae bacterium]
MNAETPRTYVIRTLGCQMNAHDSEHLAGVLDAAGYVPAAGGAIRTQGIPEADVVVFNTCAVRENAATRLFGNLGQLRAVKEARPGMQIAVGGCLAQKDRDGIVLRAPWVDVVFGTHNLGSLPALLARARHNQRAQVEIAEALTVFPSTLPTRRESAFSAWVSISVGCNNTCTFCIVPALRGRERDRRPGDILAEVEAVVAQGAVEVTLLGQNVNSYGAEFGDRGAFAKLLRAAGAVEGLERLRFTSPHPAAFTDDVIAAMAETPTAAPQLHMPLQSGSDRILRAMRRSYRAERFLGVLDRVRRAMPAAAVSTDLIVGFPGETEADFAQTLAVVERARFASAFTFQYSVRPGTPAAAMPDQVPAEVVAERFDRLVELQDRISAEENANLVGSEVEVLIAAGEGRKDKARARVSGRARDGRLVHIGIPHQPHDADRPASAVPPVRGGASQNGVAAGRSGPGRARLSLTPVARVRSPDLGGAAGLGAPRPGGVGRIPVTEAAADGLTADAGLGVPRPGDIVRTQVTGSAPHHLIADAALAGGPFELIRYASRR